LSLGKKEPAGQDGRSRRHAGNSAAHGTAGMVVVGGKSEDVRRTWEKVANPRRRDIQATERSWAGVKNCLSLDLPGLSALAEQGGRYPYSQDAWKGVAFGQSRLQTEMWGMS